jgi:hypothetical protein
MSPPPHDRSDFPSLTRLELSAGMGQIGLVLASLIQHLRAAAGRLLNQVRSAIREASRPLPVLAGLLSDVTRSRGQLLMENALLRQQLIVATRKVKRPVFGPYERGLVVLLTSFLPHWRNALLGTARDSDFSGVGGREVTRAQFRGLTPRSSHSFNAWILKMSSGAPSESAVNS